MRKHHPNHRLVKIHRNYTVEEIADLFSIHKNTVRGWVRTGLATSDNKRPMLILGHDLAAFLQARRVKNKQICKPGEIYCVCCRAPKSPAANMVEYYPVTEKFGNLSAICPDCDSIMNRRVSLAKLKQVRGKMEISFPQAIRQVTTFLSYGGIACQRQGEIIRSLGAPQQAVQSDANEIAEAVLRRLRESGTVGNSGGFDEG